MAEKLEEQLVSKVDQLGVSAMRKRRGFSYIEENPFYEPYEPTNLKLWKKETCNMKVEKLPLKQKDLLRKPTLQYIQNKTMLKGKQWIKCSLQESGSEVTWVTFSDIKWSTIKRNENMRDLISVCEEISTQDGDNKSIKSSELVLFSDTFICYPQSMSQMAESMYG